MPRFKRLVVPGMPHHVVQRGNHGMNVFLDDNDRMVFLRILGELSEENSLLIHRDSENRILFVFNDA